LKLAVAEGGTVWKLDPPTTCRTVSCPWTFTGLYEFAGASDGWLPELNIPFDSQGNIYGTTQDGGIYGTCNGQPGCGTVFELSPSGGGWTKKTLWSFGLDLDGVIPLGGVVVDAAGNLYGATYLGGDYNLGMIFELIPNGVGGWDEKVLYSFQGDVDGSYPSAGLTIAADHRGPLYGTTTSGGAGGGGTAFELIPLRMAADGRSDYSTGFPATTAAPTTANSSLTQPVTSMDKPTATASITTAPCLS
jgi:hypothetical protein